MNSIRRIPLSYVHRSSKTNPANLCLYLSSSQSRFSSREIDNDEYTSLLQPWKTLLEPPARAAWRVSDSQLPEALTQAFQSILQEGDRTPKQLLRAHRKISDLHTSLAELRERERRRLVNGKYYRGGKPSPNDGSANPVYYGFDQTLATLKHRLFPNYAISKRVLEETRSLLGSFQPERVVDFGIGCGSASAAALNVFEDSVEWVHGIDPAQPMRDCSQRLIDRMMAHRGVPPPRLTFGNALSQDAAGGTFDLALCSYTATDLPDIFSTLAAAALLFEKLKPGGVLVMIEPGTPDGFNSIRSVRNMLLDCCPPHDADFEWKERAHIVAPCTHNAKCPMERHKKEFVKKGKLAHDLPQQLEPRDDDVNSGLEDEIIDLTESDIEELDFVELSSPTGTAETDAFNSAFCSFVQTLPSSDERKKGEKFSYLVVQKRVLGESDRLLENDSFRHDNLTRMLVGAHNAATMEDGTTAQSIFDAAVRLEAKYLETSEDDLGLDLLRGEEKRKSMGRIIRAPIKKKGHVYIDYCAAPGRIIRGRIAKSSANVTPGTFPAARKSRWGGLWPDTMDKTVFSKGE